MTTIIPDPQLPRRTESGMHTRAVNAAAGVLLAAMENGRQTPTGLAIALDSACLLNSPEHAAEHEQLRAHVAELERQRNVFRDQRNNIVATNEQLHDKVTEAFEARLRAENETRTARREAGALQTRVAALEARLADYDRPTGTYPPALPWAALMDADDLEGFLEDLVDAASGDDDLSTLTEVESTIARWRLIGEAQHAHNTAPGPDAKTGRAE